ncbi:MAG: type II toxin-antitoxin system HicB family antitoxin [FCB group bacterium]|nr:type II toxin-antitoxin system HicB family antitoxin [FCB group bacterium]
MNIYEYTVIFEEEDNVWLAHVPALNGLTTEGASLEEAKLMVKDAIKGYLETLQKNHLPIPGDDIEGEPVMQKMSVAL